MGEAQGAGDQRGLRCWGERFVERDDGRWVMALFFGWLFVAAAFGVIDLLGGWFGADSGCFIGVFDSIFSFLAVVFC